VPSYEQLCSQMHDLRGHLASRCSLASPQAPAPRGAGEPLGAWASPATASVLSRSATASAAVGTGASSGARGGVPLSARAAALQLAVKMAAPSLAAAGDAACQQVRHEACAGKRMCALACARPFVCGRGGVGAEVMSPPMTGACKPAHTPTCALRFYDLPLLAGQVSRTSFVRLGRAPQRPERSQ
jgi:hypothetical protein